MAKRNSRDKVIHAIKKRRNKILQDFFAEVKALIRENKHMLEKLENGELPKSYKTELIEELDKYYKYEAKPCALKVRNSREVIVVNEIKVSIDFNKYYEQTENGIAMVFKEILYSIKEENLEKGIKLFCEFMRVADDYNGYFEIYAPNCKRFSNITNFSFEYDLMSRFLSDMCVLL